MRHFYTTQIISAHNLINVQHPCNDCVRFLPAMIKFGQHFAKSLLK